MATPCLNYIECPERPLKSLEMSTDSSLMIEVALKYKE